MTAVDDGLRIVRYFQQRRRDAIASHKSAPGSSYSPVVPPSHPFREWADHDDQCGTCGIGEDLHDNWEVVNEIYDRWREFDRYELAWLLGYLESRM